MLNIQAPELDGLQWSWAPVNDLSCSDCPAPVASPSANTTYQVTVTDPATGCSATDALTIRVVPCRRIFIPNAFSPNGDGINDYFAPSLGQCVRRVRNLRILDRWGNLVFEEENADTQSRYAGWDGTYRQHIMPPGVYVYQIMIEYGNGTTSWMTGDLTLFH